MVAAACDKRMLADRVRDMRRGGTVVGLAPKVGHCLAPPCLLGEIALAHLPPDPAAQTSDAADSPIRSRSERARVHHNFVELCNQGVGCKMYGV